MAELLDNSIHLIITSPPYYNIKDYSLDGSQINKRTDKIQGGPGEARACLFGLFHRAILCRWGDGQDFGIDASLQETGAFGDSGGGNCPPRIGSLDGRGALPSEESGKVLASFGA